MEKISVSNIVKFRRKNTQSARLTLINNLNKPKKEQDEVEGGGDYWIHSLSTISSVFASEQYEHLNEKIDFVNEKYNASPYKKIKDMYLKNIEILHNFEDYDFSKLKPSQKITFIAKPKDKSILSLRRVPVQVRPHHVFTFEENRNKKMGAVWFVSKLQGYTMEELGIFTDTLYRYLVFNYSEQYEVSPEFCSTVDVSDLVGVNYTQIINQKVPSVLNSTLDEIAKIIM